MAYPEEGKLYTVTNVGSGYNLNQIGGFTSNGTNVTLWAPDTSDSEQWWKMEGDKLYPYKCQNGSKKVCLDRYITRDANYNNADLWEDNDDTQQTIILGVDGTGDQFTIQLLNAKADDGSALYLTGASNPNGGNNPSKVPGAAGNVYWSTIPNYQAPSNYQLWRFTPVNQNPGTGGETYQKLVMPYTINRLNSSYLNEQYYADRREHHYGADILGGVEGMTEEDIYSSGAGEVVAIKWFTNLGNVLAVRYKDVLLPNGVKISSLIFRYCHLAEIYVNVNEKFSQGKKIAKRG